MKILFINLPYYGHVVPTIGLVQELIKQGCEVTYLMPFDWRDKISDSGAEFCGYKNHRQLSEQIKNAYATAESIIEQFDFVIYEQFFFLGKHLAEKYHKPVARVFTAPVTNKKLMKEFITSKGPLSIFKHKWIARAFTKDIAKNIPMKTDNWLDEIVQNPPELNLVYTLREYQPYEEEFTDEQYRFLGPSIYERTSYGFDFVKSERPVVYISLGTVIKGAAFFFQNCVDAFRGENMDVIISVGHQFDARKLKDVPSNVHIYKSVPQLDVLKLADVFVTHGGMNSVSEALVHGTPMVVIPFVSDQPVNARCIERLGVGQCLEYAKVNRNSLKNTVLSVALDCDIKTRLAKVQKLITEAPGNKGEQNCLSDITTSKFRKGVIVMAQMNVDDLVKLLDSFSQKGGASIKPEFDGEKANFVVGNGETISKGIKESVNELVACLVEKEQRNAEIFVSDDPAGCVSCANIPNMNHVDVD